MPPLFRCIYRCCAGCPTTPWDPATALLPMAAPLPDKKRDQGLFSVFAFIKWHHFWYISRIFFKIEIFRKPYIPRWS